jgi:triosephosphate isomerase
MHINNNLIYILFTLTITYSYKIIHLLKQNNFIKNKNFILYSLNKKLIVANWKMNTNLDSAINLANTISSYHKTLNNNISTNHNIVLLPPILFARDIITTIDNSNISIGCQSIYHEDNGSFTGAISASMVKSIGCKYVLVGHSERRIKFKETNSEINLMLNQIHKENMVPILCIGETLEEYNLGLNKEICRQQLSENLVGLNKNEILNTVVAYEPIWAIGTGKTPNYKEIEDIHLTIRLWFYVNYGKHVAKNIFIIYGGSVNEKNICDINKCKYVNGILVGSSSLNSNTFINIIDNYIK